MKKTNITFIISYTNKSLGFEWLCSSLDKNKFNPLFILLNPGDSELEQYLQKNNFSMERIRYAGKKDVVKAIWQTYKILKKRNTDIVHAHLFDASLVGITVAWALRIKKRIYTRHHSTYHHIYSPKAVKYDRLVNLLSTDIIAITDVVKNILIEKENVSEKKIHVIHHGFKLDNFTKVPEQNVLNLKQKYATSDFKPVIGVIARHIELKGIQYIIPAFERFLQSYPNALLILANANGEYNNTLKSLLERVPSKSYIEIRFEMDVFSLYKLFDIYVHVPIDSELEAFGQTYVEALAAGIPSIFTLSGVAPEFIKNRHNALVVPFKNTDAIYNSMIELTENKALQATLISNGEKDVLEKFNLDKMILSLEQLYAK